MQFAKHSIFSCLFLLIWLNGLVAELPAQGFLERLEDRIRQRLGGGVEEPDNSGSAPVPVDPSQPLSLGIEAEERGRGYPFQVVIVSVRRDSFSALAGLRPGDVITSLDGKPVGSIDDIAVVVRQKKLGDQIAVVIDRQGEKQELAVSFARPGSDSAARETIQRPKPGSGRLGVTVENPTTTPPGAGVPVERGAVVVAVAADSPASQAGLQPGDVIISINGAVIDEAAKLIEMISATTPGQVVDLTYYKGESLVKARVTLAGVTEPAASLPLPPGNLPETGPPTTDPTALLRAEVDRLRTQLEALEKRLSALERQSLDPPSTATEPSLP
jgi:S1-C subfamily serine protease